MEKLTGLDVVIAGGGTVGLCTAYFLQRAGMRVTVIEQSVTGCHAPRIKFTECMREPSPSSSLARRGITLLSDVISDLGYSFRMVVRGEPESDGAITLPVLRKGTNAEELQLPEFLSDLASLISEKGGRIFEGIQVDGLIFSQGRVTGVSTASGQFLADEVVMATGLAIKPFEADLGLELNLKASDPQSFLHRCDDIRVSRLPCTPSGRPYLGRPAGVAGAIVAIGHELNPISALSIGKMATDLVSKPWDEPEGWRVYSPNDAALHTFPWPGI